MSLGLTDPGWFRFRKTDDFIPDHGHLMHLFAIRMPGMDRMWHLHPDEQKSGGFALDLPDMPAGSYKLFADVVHANGIRGDAGDECGAAGDSWTRAARRRCGWSRTANWRR